MIQKSADLADAMVADALTSEPGATARFVHIALGVLLAHRRYPGAASLRIKCARPPMPYCRGPWASPTA